MTKDEFVELASGHVEDHFPKGKTNMRGEAMVLVAMICKDLLDAGVLTEGNDMTKHSQDTNTGSPLSRPSLPLQLREQLEHEAEMYRLSAKKDRPERLARLETLLTSEIDKATTAARISELEMHRSHESGTAGSIYISNLDVERRLAQLNKSILE